MMQNQNQMIRSLLLHVSYSRFLLSNGLREDNEHCVMDCPLWALRS